MGNSSSVCSDLWQLSARASLPWQLSLILLLCLLPCCVPPSQFVAPFWLLRIIANTLAAISLCQSTPLTLPLSFGVAVCLTLQPLKLHALALAIIEARHQSLMGQATRPTCNCGNTIANCTGQLPGQLLSWPGKWSSLQLETAKTSLHQQNNRKYRIENCV